MLLLLLCSFETNYVIYFHIRKSTTKSLLESLPGNKALMNKSRLKSYCTVCFKINRTSLQQLQNPEMEKPNLNVEMLGK